MKKIIILIVLFVFVLCPAYSDTYVNGYYRKNGTYVEPYLRSNRDGYKYNNYSTKGRLNPYTGKKGTVKSKRYNTKKVKKSKYIIEYGSD